MKKVFCLFVAIGMLFGAAAASAQGQNCGQRGAVVERLAGQYGESRQSIMMAPQSRVVEVWASLETGTWTITVTLPSGMTCLVASGQSYEVLDEAPALQGDPT